MRLCRIFLCALMSVCLLAGLLPAGALADTVSAPYHSYVSLGDSIPAGRGKFPQQTMRGFTRIEGIYPTLVADALGAEFTPLAYCGFRTNEIRWMLEACGDKRLMPAEEKWRKLSAEQSFQAGAEEIAARFKRD